MRFPAWQCLAMLVLLGLPWRTVGAQCPTCTIVRTNSDTSVVIQIGVTRYLALTPSQQDDILRLQERVDRAEKLLAIKDSLYRESERLRASYDTTLADQRRYSAVLDSLYRGYRNLASGYKRLTGEPLLSFNAGLGVTGSGTEPAIIAGFGLWRFGVWGFFQQHNTGVLVGTSWRLF